MLTYDFDSPASGPDQREAVSSDTPSQTVVIVDGHAEAMDHIELMLEDGNYDLVFVESAGSAFSQVKRAQPHFVVVCANFDRPEGLHILSMLKLDKDTCHIPTFVCTIDPDEPAAEDGEDPESAPAVFARRPSPGMN